MTRIAIPVKSHSSRDDQVYGHFGKAPVYHVINDINDPSKDEALENKSNHFDGELSPPDFLNSKHIDVLITSSIGKGAYNKLNIHGVKIYRTKKQSIADILREYSENKLEIMSEDMAHSHKKH